MIQQISPFFDLKTDKKGREYLEVSVGGIALLRFSLTNKGTGFNESERVALGLDGLLPPQIATMEQQITRVYGGYLREQSDLGRYQYLRSLQERHEILFYAVLGQHLEEMLPIVYTPTVGDAVKQYSHLYQHPRGLSFSSANIGRAQVVASNYPLLDVRMIVATDSSAILGIGDQGYGGLAIPIGKLALYTVGGGVSPFHTMPVSLDVGTNRDDLLEDPHYLGYRQRRLEDDEYYRFVDKFVAAVKKRWPKAIIQWEDLSKKRAFQVLERYRDVLPSFNDDVQGTGAVTLGGLVSGCRLRGERLVDQRIVILGAGAGGVGVAWALRKGMEREGLSEEEALSRVMVLDSRGLLVEDRRDTELYKRPFCQRHETIEDWPCEGVPDLLDTVRYSRATALIGLSGQPGCFDERLVRLMAENTERPMIFPLSNPTSSCEGLPVDILTWTEGKAIVATGSPFDPVELDGVTYPIGQGNNAFIFPGLGFGAILCEATILTDEMVLEAAYALSDYTEARYLESGRIYPPVDELHKVSQLVAARVIRCACKENVATNADLYDLDDDGLLAYVQSKFWYPKYLPVHKRVLP